MSEGRVDLADGAGDRPLGVHDALDCQGGILEPAAQDSCIPVSYTHLTDERRSGRAVPLSDG